MTTINMIHRKKDIYLGGEDIENLFTFENFPVYMGVTSQNSELDLKADMEWGISKNSGVVQLTKLIPLDILYKDSHNSGLGGVWLEHNIEFARFLSQYVNKGVVEIGGGNGILNSVYNKNFTEIDWTIIEPSNVECVGETNAKYIKAFFDIETVRSVKELGIMYDTLVHSHLIEHQYELNQFIDNCEKMLFSGQYMVFSMPNLELWLKKKYTNALNFEHTYLLTEKYIDILLARHGFIIDDKRYYKEHSIFYAAKYTGIYDVTEHNYLDEYSSNKKLFLDFVDYFKQEITRINQIIAQNNERKIFLFGAHIFSQYLIQFGLDTSKVISVLDNDTNKQGKRLYGTNLMVESPKILKNISEPLVILKVAAYKDEIMNDILLNINENAIFLT